MCIIAPKEIYQRQLKMVTPSKSHPTSKVGGSGNNIKRPHHAANKRQQQHASYVQVPFQAPSTSPQQNKGGGRPNHIQQKNNQNNMNRNSPNYQQNFHNQQKSQMQNRQNRQTPPRNSGSGTPSNHVNMNNGQPMLERTRSSDQQQQPKFDRMVQNKQQQQKTTTIAAQNQSAQHQQAQKQKGYAPSVVVSHGGMSRSSPVTTSKSNRSSPQCFAGSKCFEPPTANCLPKPPSDWTPVVFNSIMMMNDKNNAAALDNCNRVSVSPARDVSHELKLILNVHA